MNPMLGISLGVGPGETERLAAIRQALQEDETDHAESVGELVERFGADAPDGIRWSSPHEWTGSIRDAPAAASHPTAS